MFIPDKMQLLCTQKPKQCIALYLDSMIISNKVKIISSLLYGYKTSAISNIDMIPSHCCIPTISTSRWISHCQTPVFLRERKVQLIHYSHKYIFIYTEIKSICSEGGEKINKSSHKHVGLLLLLILLGQVCSFSQHNQSVCLKDMP